MSEPKPLASLSGSLLARKGAAKPAMRRQGMTGTMPAGHLHHDDLGWNDMGYDVNPAPSDEQATHQRVELTPMVSPVQALREGGSDEGQDHALSAPVPEVVRQREVLAEKLKRPEGAGAPAIPAPAIVEGVVPATPSPIFARPAAEAAVTAPAPTVPAVAAAAMPVEASKAVPAKTPRPRRQPGLGAKAAFTLRIDPERHLRLRLASAVTRRSAQVILIEALDKYLKSLPDIDVLAHQLPNK